MPIAIFKKSRQAKQTTESVLAIGRRAASGSRIAECRQLSEAAMPAMGHQRSNSHGRVE